MAINLDTADDTLNVELTGFDAVFALKRRLRIPMERLSAIEVRDRADVGFGPWTRLPGTYFPGVVRHGSYGTGAVREFWAVYRQPKLLVITVESWSYSRLVLGVAEPEKLALQLQAASRR